MNSNRISIILSAIMSLLFFVNSAAQVKESSELYKTIMKNDSMVFQIGFNTCNMDAFDRMVSTNFRFFHDKSGITNSKEEFIAGIKNGLCSNPNQFKSKRELEKGSTEVYPLYDKNVLYGAIQKGNHFFYESKNGETEQKVAVAKFIHTWIIEDGKWLLTEVLSFDHQPIINTPDKVEIREEQLRKFIGIYQAPNTGKVEIATCPDGISLKTEKMTSCFYATSENVFKHIQAPLTISFSEMEGGNMKMTVKENNKIVEEAIRESINKTITK